MEIMRVSVILPIRNQEKNIIKNFDNICKFLKRRDIETIVVMSGRSEDNSLKLLKGLRKKYGFRLLYGDKGRGNALRTGIRAAKGDVIGYFDTDLAVPLRFVPEAIRKCREYDLVIGSRYLKRSNAERRWNRYIASKVFNSMVRVFLGSDIVDHLCGFKFFRRRFILKHLNEMRDPHWFFDVEMLLMAKRENARVYEMPVDYKEGTSTTAKASDAFYLTAAILKKAFRT